MDRNSHRLGIKFLPHAILPLINIPRHELRIRRDIEFLLSELDIPSSSLIYLDDFHNDLTNEFSRFHAFLVDHNRLTDELHSVFQDRVIGIIDHHADEGQYLQSIEAFGGPRIIQKSGSCSSLIVNYWKNIFVDLDSSPLNDFSVAILALAPLLIDTSNMQYKVESHDTEAFEYLQKIYKPSAQSEKELFSFYQDINSKKKSIEGLDPQDILRKDYKEWSGNNMKVGISSTVKSLSWLTQEHENLVSEIGSFSRNHDLDIHITMTTSTNPNNNNFQREQAIWFKDEKSKSLADKYISTFRDELGLELTSTITEDNVLSFQQHVTSASRKQVAPLIKNIVFGTKLESL